MTTVAKRTVSVLLCAAMLLAALVSSAVPAEAARGRTGVEASAEAWLLGHHNRVRGSAGTLARVGELDAVARAWADTMARDGSLRHNPNYTSQVKNWKMVAENVGRAGPSDDVQAMIVWIADGYMESSGHRKNIMDPQFTQVGIGVSVGADGNVWNAVVFRNPTSAPMPPDPPPAPKPDPDPKPAPAPKPEPAPKPAPAPKPDPAPKPAPAPKPEPAPKPAPAPKPDPGPKPAPQTEAAAPSGRQAAPGANSANPPDATGAGGANRSGNSGIGPAAAPSDATATGQAPADSPPPAETAGPAEGQIVARDTFADDDRSQLSVRSTGVSEPPADGLGTRVAGVLRKAWSWVTSLLD